MSKKSKHNYDISDDLQVISLSDENITYRTNITYSKNITLQEKQRIQKNYSDTTVCFFDLDDLNRLKMIERQIYQHSNEKTKKGILYHLANFFDVK